MFAAGFCLPPALSLTRPEGRGGLHCASCVRMNHGKHHGVDFSAGGVEQVMAALDNGNSEAADGGSAVLGGPVPDSPRTVWFRENRKMLDEKEEEEKVAKQAVKQVAVEFMEKFHKVGM